MVVSPEIVTALQPLANTVAALMTLSMLSILWKENPIYRLCEHLVIGASAAHWIIVTFVNTIKPRVLGDMLTEGQYWQIIPICLGLLVYFQFFGKLRWISKIPTSVWIGYGAGMTLTMRTFMPLFAHAQATMVKLIVIGENGVDLLASINSTLFFSVFVLTMLYFFYSFKGLHTKPMLRAGRWVIMLAYGCSFGNAVTGRISLFLGRLQFLLGTWLGVL